MKNTILVLLLFGILSVCYGQKLEVVIDQINNSNGVIRMAIYKSQKEFSDKNAYQLLTFSKDDMKDGQLKVIIDLPKGIFGVSILDDSNKNTKMDYGMFGIPKEGYAFSNFYHTGMSMPKFDDFKFDSNKYIKVYCKMRYL